MKFTKLSLNNFKSFRRLVYEPSALNVFTGLNGSGKSSLIQYLLFLREMTQKSDSAPWFVGLDGDSHSFGTYADLHYAYSQDEADGVRMCFSLDGDPQEYRFRVADADSVAEEVRVDFEGAMPDQEKWRRMLTSLKSVQYISAYRLPPREDHKYSVKRVQNHDWGALGEYAVAYLAEEGMKKLVAENMCNKDQPDRHLQAQVDAWMNIVSPGARVNAENLGKINRVKLSVSFAKGVNEHPFLPQNVGFGISYVLPVLIMVLRSEPGDCLIIENPEAHLHPKGQAEFGRLLALAAASGVQVFVETHSDHVLNGIRVAVKNGPTDPADVKVAFFSRQVTVNAGGAYEQESVLEELHVNKEGEFDHFPPDFMDEWNKQLLELLQP